MIQSYFFQYHSYSYLPIAFKIIFYETTLYLAVENENIEIVKLLLSNDNIDVNVGYIFNYNFLWYFDHIFQ